MTDWTACIKTRIVKNVSKDVNFIKSTKEIAQLKIESANALPEHLFIGKIILLYDALREYLECVAMEKGFKIYNHECYTAFLKEILHFSMEGDIFDNARKVRNGINYYGKTVTQEEASQMLLDLKVLIEKFKN
ncbi:hypothetical protein J4410_03945 [Candidatus Woesearchaeota archaeon]|nr:hypothetical protein [Candidatus Woesearchaeota archaeon]